MTKRASGRCTCATRIKRGREFVLRKVYNYKKIKTEQEYFYCILFTVRSGSLRTHHLSSGTSPGSRARHTPISHDVFVQKFTGYMLHINMNRS